jgi:hypothetical protein
MKSYALETTSKNTLINTGKKPQPSTCIMIRAYINGKEHTSKPVPRITGKYRKQLKFPLFLLIIKNPCNFHLKDECKLYLNLLS